MAGLLSGLARFGLGDLEDAEIFSAEEKQDKKEAEKVAKVPEEQDFLYDKKYTCPICETVFPARTIRSAKVKMLGADIDLRPRYEQADKLKYDVVCCTHCGYAALGVNFNQVGPKQAELIRQKICAAYKPIDQDKKKLVYSYDEAIEHYKLALASSIVKQAKTSDKAYVCLKTAWVIRGKKEKLPMDVKNRASVIAELEKEENSFLKSALEGFVAARGTEEYPMCGMDEMTVDYLISALAAHFGQMAIAKKFLSGILASQSVNKRLKDKARDLKDMIV